MPKINKRISKITFSILIASLAASFSLLVVSFLTSNQAFAAVPGCYTRTAGSVTEIESTTCPASLNPEPDACYVAQISPSQGLGPFTETDCTSFQVGSIDHANNNNDNLGGLVSGEELDTDCQRTGGEELSEGNCAIIKYLVIAINFLSAAAGLVMVFSLIFAGYQYITARDNPNFVQAAKMRILWTIVALFSFIFMYSFLNFIVPGGVLP